KKFQPDPSVVGRVIGGTLVLPPIFFPPPFWYSFCPGLYNKIKKTKKNKIQTTGKEDLVVSTG
ncbi:hypothetical protein, partial [Bacillus sp. GbtcB13]|uniref:hypothetical protein n=1 Tax=Bacillus sp. GbtcB13 TaxID=2824758 RepID=UPI001C2F6665